jgi:hypothetical protein
MPSSNNVETMFVQHYYNVETMFIQHYSEKGSDRSGNVAVSHKPAMYRKSLSYKTMVRVGNDAATETSLVSYFFLSSIIPQDCGSGNDATIKINQHGDDAVSRPTR